MPGIKSYHFVDKVEAYKEFKEIFAGQPDLISALDPSQMPPSFRVVPTRAQEVNALAKEFEGQAGVRQVTFAQQVIAQLLKTSHKVRILAEIFAAAVMIGAVALIINTIQLAIFARRREVAVMKLVGATNWFIRVPFMLEGLIHGIVGAVLAFVAVYLFRNTIASFVGNTDFITQNIVITPHEAVLTGLVVLLVGAVLGALGSAFAVRRFLSV